MQTSPAKKNSSPSPSQKSQTITKASSQKSKIKFPKRNKSAFIIFSQDKRPQVKQETQLNSNEMMVKLGELWRDLNPEIKESYEKQAADDKERYLREMEEFSKEHPSAKIIHNRTKNSYVKKPCSAYAIFLKENLETVRQENPGLKMADLLKVISNKWNELSTEKRKGYQRKAIKEQERTKKKQEQIKMDNKPRKRERKLKTEKKKLEEVEVEVEEEGEGEEAVLFDESEGHKPETIESVQTSSEEFDNIDKYFSSSQDELGQGKQDFDSFIDSLEMPNLEKGFMIVEAVHPKPAYLFDLNTFDYQSRFSMTFSNF